MDSVIQNFASKVVAKMCISEKASTTICVAPVPVTEFDGCNIDEIITDPCFHLRTVLIVNDNQHPQDVMNVNMDEVFQIKGNVKEILSRVTLKMSQDVQPLEQPVERLEKVLGTMDVKGVIVYYLESDHVRIATIKEVMFNTMWEAMRFSETEKEAQSEKKRKLDSL